MDYEIIERLREKYKGDEDIELLLEEISRLELKLINADILAMIVDFAVKTRVLDSRSAISDARLEYGKPWNYEDNSKQTLLEYTERFPELKRVLETNT